MKKLIFIVVFFLVSVFSFSQSNFMTSNFNETYKATMYAKATYTLIDKSIERTAVNQFNKTTTEKVNYSYSTKKLSINNAVGKHSITIDNAYIEKYEKKAGANNTWTRYFVYIKLNNPNIKYGLVAVIDITNMSGSIDGHVTHITNIK